MNVPLLTYWRELATGTRSTPADRLAILLLAPFSQIYSCIQYLRAGLYRIENQPSAATGCLNR